MFFIYMLILFNIFIITVKIFFTNGQFFRVIFYFSGRFYIMFLLLRIKILLQIAKYIGHELFNKIDNSFKLH